MWGLQEGEGVRRNLRGPVPFLPWWIRGVVDDGGVVRCKWWKVDLARC